MNLISQCNSCLPCIFIEICSQFFHVDSFLHNHRLRTPYRTSIEPCIWCPSKKRQLRQIWCVNGGWRKVNITLTLANLFRSATLVSQKCDLYLAFSSLLCFFFSSWDLYSGANSMLIPLISLVVHGEKKSNHTSIFVTHCIFFWVSGSRLLLQEGEVHPWQVVIQTHNHTQTHL